jgi:hypothetical protein
MFIDSFNESPLKVALLLAAGFFVGFVFQFNPRVLLLLVIATIIILILLPLHTAIIEYLENATNQCNSDSSEDTDTECAQEEKVNEEIFIL